MVELLQNSFAGEIGKRFHEFFKHVATCMVICQTDGRFVEVNKPFCNLAGYSRKELLSMSFEEITHTDDISYVMKKFQSVLDGKSSSFKLEKRFIRKDRSIIWVHLTASLIRNEKKQPVCFVGTFEDITKHKQAESAMSMEKTLLRTLIDQIPSGIFVKDKDYKKIIVNTEHLREVRDHLKSLGRDENIDILNKTDFDVFPRELAEKFFNDDQKVIRDGQSIINKVEYGVNPDGTRTWFLVSKVPLYDREGKITGMVGVTSNITSQMEIEEELINAKEKAEESDRLKSIFLANMSHEVRTPLNAILGFSGLLDSPNLTEERRKRYVNLIRVSGSRLIQLINDIIDISHIEAQQLALDLQKRNIYDIVRRSYEIFQNSEVLKQKPEVSLYLKYPKECESIETVTDEIRLQQVLDNLIMNALKYTEKGFVEVGVSVKEKDRNNYIEFYVKDTGSGIPEDKQHVIFERFRQAEEHSYHKGTGLGLSISKGIVKLLGGEIWLVSKHKVGSTFYFTIPHNPE